MSVEQTLQDRDCVHGAYYEQATTAETLKKLMHGGKYWDTMTPVQHEALDMIAVKLSRILTGNPNYPDHWHDIQGYARLVERTLGPN